MNRTRNLQCPKCGKQNAEHWSMICVDCNVIMMPTTAPPKEERKGGGEDVPTTIFKGKGWTPKFHGGDNNE